MMHYDANMRAADLLTGNLMAVCFYSMIGLGVIAFLLMIFNSKPEKLEGQLGWLVGGATGLYFIGELSLALYQLNGWRNICGTLLVGSVCWVLFVFSSQAALAFRAGESADRALAAKEVLD